LHDRKVIILATEPEVNLFHIRVCPDLQKIVRGSDRGYLASLLDDFKHRAGVDSSALFERLLSLGVGFVVTYETGTDLAGHPALLGMNAEFVDLECVHSQVGPNCRRRRRGRGKSRFASEEMNRRRTWRSC